MDYEERARQQDEFKQDLARQRREYLMRLTGMSLDEVIALEEEHKRMGPPVEPEPLDRIADALERIATALESRA